MESLCFVNAEPLKNLLNVVISYLDLSSRGYVDFSKLFHFIKPLSGNQQEKQRYAQDIESLQKERLQWLQKLEMTENVVEKQQQMYESKIQILREKVKVYKLETSDSRQALETLHRKEQERQEQVFSFN